MDYDEFRHNFEIQSLPPWYHLNLDEEIRKQTQGEGESFRCFVVAVGTPIRRSGGFSEVEKLDLLYRNMRPDYKLFVRRQGFSSLPQMIERAEHYGAYLREKASFRPPPFPAMSLVPETAYYPKRKPNQPLDSVVVDGYFQVAGLEYQKGSRTKIEGEGNNLKIIRRRPLGLSGRQKARLCQPKAKQVTDGSRLDSLGNHKTVDEIGFCGVIDAARLGI